MATIPISASLVPCAGIGCGKHKCPNYEAFEGSDPAEFRIGTCVGLGEHKLSARLSSVALEAAK